MRTKILMLVVLMGLAVAGMAQRVDKGSRKPFRGPDKEMKMNDHQRDAGRVMNLTDEQKEAFKQSVLAVQKQLQPLRNELGELKARQKTLMTAERPDKRDIDKNIEKMGALRVEMEKIQAQHRLDMRAQLTGEQRLLIYMHHGKMMRHKGFKGTRQGRGMQKRHLRG
jgi:Spy/CpxP family protein refolding chaperone